jgi:superkiller protein 3
MEARVSKKPETRRPSLARAGILFGAALMTSLAVGVFLYSSRPERGGSSAREAVEPAALTSIGTSDSAEVELPPVVWGDAEAAFAQGRNEEAATLFTRYAQENPGNPWGHYMAGLAERRSGRLDEAERAFRAALELEENHLKARVNLARTLLDAKRPLDALAEASLAVEVDPQSVDAQRVSGRALHTLGRREEAREAYRKALALDPNDAWSLNNLGLTLIEEERFEEAKSPLETAAALDPTIPCFLNNLGIALERSGDLAGAERAYRGALALDESYEKPRVSLARVEPLAESEEMPELAIGSSPLGSAPSEKAPETEKGSETIK